MKATLLFNTIILQLCVVNCLSDHQIIDSYTDTINGLMDYLNGSIFTINTFMNVSRDDDICYKSIEIIEVLARKVILDCDIINNINASECIFNHWSFRMIDALPTKPTGLSRKGPFFLIGDYDLCEKVRKEDRQNVHYCTLKGSLVTPTQQTTPLTIGLCLPVECREESFKNMIGMAGRIYDKYRYEMDTVYCSDGNNINWMNKQMYIALIILFVICFLSFASIVEKYQRNGYIQTNNRSDRSDREDGGEDELIIDNDKCSSIQGAYAPSLALTYRSISLNMKRWAAHSILIETFTSFSITSSLAYLFRNSTKEVNLVNGFRVLSSFWVTFSHVCLFSLNFTDTIKSIATTKSENDLLLSSFMLNSSLAVDSFLFLSACVASYSIRKRLIFRGDDNTYSFFRILSVIGHRIFRLLPSLFIYLCFMSFLYNSLGDGPFWNENGMFGSECNISSVIPNLLFVSNYFPSSCVPWLWHISLDFQLYLTFPLAFFLLAKFRNGWMWLTVLIIASLLYRTIIYSLYTLPPNMFVEMLSGKFEKAATSFRLLYTSPLSRAPPFIIGLITGWYICRLPTVSPKWYYSFILHSIAFVCLLISLFGPYFKHPFLQYSHAIFHRSIWAIGLAILVYLAQSRMIIGFMNVLSDHRLAPLSRLSFGVFLSHEPILLMYLNTLRQPISPSSFGYFTFMTVSIHVLSLLSAFIIAIVIEIPLLTLERKLLMTTKIKKPTNLHVSFQNETLIEADCDNREMDFEEKAKQWLETGRIVNLVASGDKQMINITQENEDEATSTAC